MADAEEDASIPPAFLSLGLKIVYVCLKKEFRLIT